MNIYENIRLYIGEKPETIAEFSVVIVTTGLK